MKLTKKDVQHVAALARLGLSDAEAEKFQVQLSGILEYVQQLNGVDTEGIEPTAQVTGLLNVMRDDAVKPVILADPEKLLSCSPLPVEKNQIKVKSVF